MDGVLKKMQGFDFTKFKEELGKRGFKVREARASTGKLNGYYVTARSELKRVEVYTKRIEDATARKVQIDGKSLESAENRLKTCWRTLNGRGTE